MISLNILGRRFKKNVLTDHASYNDDFLSCIDDLISHDEVCKMKEYNHHKNINCFDHSYRVSKYSFIVCRIFGFDSESAARGGMLHDFYLYNWHIRGSRRRFHGITHPKTALKNASNLFDLNDIEKNIIVTHMWPLTFTFPKYKESYVIVLVDKICAIQEFFGY